EVDEIAVRTHPPFHRNLRLAIPFVFCVSGGVWIPVARPASVIATAQHERVKTACRRGAVHRSILNNCGCQLSGTVRARENQSERTLQPIGAMRLDPTVDLEVLVRCRWI